MPDALRLAPIAPVVAARAASCEEVPDEGEPSSPIPVEPAGEPITLDLGPLDEHVTPGLEIKPTKKVTLMPAPTRQPPAMKVAKRGRSILKKPSPRSSPPEPHIDPLDSDDIKLRSAPNFLATQKGVTVRRTTMEELELSTQLHDSKAFTLPELTEDQFRDILGGRGDKDIWKQQFGSGLHDFLDACYAAPGDNSSDVIRLRKITKEDAVKFMDKADRGYRILEEIKAKVLDMLQYRLGAFNPADADKLPPHRSFDHRIELIPGQKLPYSRNRPASQLENRVIKRWLDETSLNRLRRQ